MKVSKLLFALPLVGFAFAANAEIKVDDSKNVSYGDMAINADGSVLVDGKEVAKCQGDKLTKLKAAAVTCDDDFVSVKDKKGETLSRFSGYAKVSTAKGDEERKQFDESLATLGSASTGDAERTVTKTQTLTEQSVNKTVVVPSADTTVKPPVNEKNYIPKLGVEATDSPEIRNNERPADMTKDKTEENFVEQQKADPDAPPPVSVTVKTIKTPPTVTETTKTTTIAIPADGGKAVNNTQTDSKIIQDPSAAQ